MHLVQLLRTLGLLLLALGLFAVSTGPVTARTVAVGPPAPAATLTVPWVDCAVYSYGGYYSGNYRCYASVSGGTGTYVSYTWNVTSNKGNYTVVTTTNTLERACYAGTPSGKYREVLWATVIVKDSAGATARGVSQTVTCGEMIMP